MGLTLTKRKAEHRYSHIRLTAQVLCECGKPATKQVGFVQINSSGKRQLGTLPVCDECFALMLKIDPYVEEVH